MVGFILIRGGGVQRGGTMSNGEHAEVRRGMANEAKVEVRASIVEL